MRNLTLLFYAVVSFLLGVTAVGIFALTSSAWPAELREALAIALVAVTAAAPLIFVVAALYISGPEREPRPRTMTPPNADVAEREASNRCVECGAALGEDAYYCRFCGEPVRKTAK